jgi:uncharacterized YccA/Bax inhibitor family protein
MSAIGRLANFLVAIVETFVFGFLKVIGLMIGAACVVYSLSVSWSMIDGSHLGSLRSIGGIIGLTFVIVMTLSAIGELLDPFDFMNVTDTNDGAKKATRADLRKAGLIRRR